VCYSFRLEAREVLAVKRRDFITLLGGAAAWPLAAYAQQEDRVRRIGILMPYPPTNAEMQARVRRFSGGAAKTWLGGQHRVTINAFMEQTIATIARHRLPAICSERVFVTTGGLVSYGTDRVEQYRGAASYVDRVLRGEKAGDLPFQQPTKYELVINLATAKTLGLTIPPTLLFTADEVIE
jgi:ABC-type uncharacterized transport system substrate-binding protein